jgi:uncharacterized membrane protein
MLQLLQLVATFCAAIFAGAALYINLVEHPARLGLGSAAALAQWAPSYQRATLMQAPLAIIAFLSALTVYALDGEILWLIAGFLIGTVVPFTFLSIMPTNKRLLAPDRDPQSPETRSLLEHWGRLHGVRTVLSLLATALMLWGLATG